MARTNIPTHAIREDQTAVAPSGIKDVMVAAVEDEGKIFPRQYPHRHNYYEILLLNNSSGVHHIDFVAYPFEGSVVFMLSPEQVHLLNRVGSSGFSVQFNPAFFSSGNDPDSQLLAHFLFDNVQAYPVVSLDAAALTRLSGLMTMALEEYNKADADATAMLFSYIRVILMEIMRIRRTQLQEPHLLPGLQQTQLLEFKKLLHRHFNTLHEVQDYAAKMHITPRQLNSLAQKLTGQTAGALIRDRILLEARRLLVLEESSVKEIAYQVGFEDPAYFNRFFKKNTGQSPLQFREQARHG
ncbi:AraC family transcriptional regulator [Chitinophaga solisilvae]|uniref:AraC family transcriptional regulator n=1 Tax=Chitinophaga solisilvae TaxID=1233460 RepID=A0A433WP26_9BACT|nr:AraC family transcriptional regulator [Chitinophaga solisilvae]NSL89275.1 AraC family transcriptional regulator [Chitinophaga solisilvae]